MQPFWLGAAKKSIISLASSFLLNKYQKTKTKHRQESSMIPNGIHKKNKLTPHWMNCSSKCHLNLLQDSYTSCFKKNWSWSLWKHRQMIIQSIILCTPKVPNFYVRHKNMDPTLILLMLKLSGNILVPNNGHKYRNKGITSCLESAFHKR